MEIVLNITLYLLLVENSLGTLGGGNHFIEANQDEAGRLYIVIHSGSRRLGLEIANFYQDAAHKALNSRKEEIDTLIADLKRQGREQEIEGVLRGLKSRPVNIPRPLAYLEGWLLEENREELDGVSVSEEKLAAMAESRLRDEIRRNAEETREYVQNFLI